MVDETHDVIVIGTSQGGRFLPVDLARAGNKVALIERDHLGGVCVNTGITVLTSATTERIEAAGGNRVRLTVRTPDGERQLEGSHLLSAIGRVPNTEALTPAAAGIRLSDQGFIEVDEYLETSVPGVYAMGDVKGGPAFTHLSYDDYRIMRANLLGGDKASTRDRMIPYTVFIDPQLGRVGLTERQARAQDRAVRQFPYTAMANAVFTHPLLAEGLNSLFMTLDA